jgi:hypothetical protein
MMAPIVLALVLASGTTGGAADSPPQLVLEPARSARDQIGGGSQSFRIASAVLGQSRRVFVHFPASFAKSSPARRYPTTILLDGEFLLLPVVAVSDVLVRKGQIPESVIVSVENTDDYRGRLHDLTPPGLSVSGSTLNEGGDFFLDFLEKELLPALDAQFRTGEPRALVGTSSGGVLVTYAAATRGAFRLTLALDTPMHLGDGWLAKKLLQRTAAAGPPLRYASIEARFGWSEDQWKGLAAAAPPSWLLHREKLVHESHESMQFLGAYLGLRELFRDYSMLAAPVAPTTSILPSYEKLRASWGTPVTPPEPLLAQVVDDLLMEGRGAAAHAAFDALTFAYGAPADAAALRQRIAEAERRPPPTETVESLLEAPFPTVDEARDYIGEWEGEQWIAPESKSRFALRVAAEKGRIAATMVSWPEPKVELARSVQYLKVTPEGLTFGAMNGMRPRGMLLHEGRRDGDTLTGELRFGGVNFTPPAGQEMPTLRFSLRRKRTEN